MKPFAVLKKAFLALTDTQLRRLAWHVREGTPICCGRPAPYIDEKGGG